MSKRVIRLTESDLSRIVKKVISENQYNKIINESIDLVNLLKVKGNSQIYTTLVNTIYNSRSRSYKGMGKYLANNRRDVDFLVLALINWYSKNKSLNPTLLIATICIILRESKGSPMSFLVPKEIGGAIKNLFGGDASQGYAQVRPSVAKSYKLDPSLFNSMEGSLKGAYIMLYKNYQTAKKFYNGNFVTIYENGKLVKKPAINGDAALHMAIAVHNGGLGLLRKWCKTNMPNIANPCNVPQRDPYDNGKIATTNKNEVIPNYFPKKGHVHGYMPEIVQNFNAFKGIPNLLSKLKI